MLVTGGGHAGHGDYYSENSDGGEHDGEDGSERIVVTAVAVAEMIKVAMMKPHESRNLRFVYVYMPSFKVEPDTQCTRHEPLSNEQVCDNNNH